LVSSACRVLCLAGFLAVLSLGGLGWAQTFEETVEEALRRRESLETLPPLLQPFPPPAAPGAAGPAQPVPAQPIPAQPDFAPVELQPRPYTPPKPSTPATPAAPPAAAADGVPAAPPVSGAVPAAPGSLSPPETAADPLAEERALASLTPDEVNAAIFVEDANAARGASPIVLKAQVLLDRAGASPGIIDAYAGGNVAKAVAAVEDVLGLNADGILDRQVWDAIGGDSAPPVLVQYTITAEDLAYPFLQQVPQDYALQAQLPGLNYTSPEEMFGERFHMNVKLLAALNPAADFRRAGTTIWVAAVEGQAVAGKIARIEADKTRRQLRAYDAENRLIVAYPATIGSPDNPSPSGEHVVKGVAHDPIYYYDPKNFVQGQNLEQLELPAGPNNPVGSVWIDLSEPSYGIHGTPEPALIDKTGSHGCVRLTNWDAEELASLVEPGVPVSFIE
jgi:lipoprotein-anchoring transpeptidase ErfK/SrfK